MRAERFDVVVVGCGAGGLSAAVSAAESGARVAVLERAPRAERGGQSRYTEAYLRMKSHTEVSDDFEEHLAENGAGYVDPDLIAETARPVSDRAAYVTALSVTEPDFITTGSDDGPTVAKAMHAMPVDDATLHGGSILPNGRVLQDVYLVRVKAPAQSKQPWDYYDVLSTIPGKDAFMTEQESGCQLP